MEVLQQYIDSCAIEQTEPAYVSQNKSRCGQSDCDFARLGTGAFRRLGLTEGVPAGVVAALRERAATQAIYL